MNIIQIHNHDIHSANRAFAEFMNKTECFLNEKTRGNHSLYKKCKSDELEQVALNALWEVSSSTPFRKEDIKLVAGQKFPDIIAGNYYGVEVKSTKENSWKSTGSSIVESTRIADVENIYMLFGKLGGQYAEFKCKPYQDCLSNIAVTHSPRYLIDMELTDNQVPTIFEKMDTEYDTFRLLPETEKVAYLRQYYKQQAKTKNKHEMPWWMGDNFVSNPVVSLYTDLELIEKCKIQIRMLVLFPEDVLNSDYQQIALWLCTRFSVINPNMRDLFSAGGQVEKLGNITFEHKMPQVIKRFYDKRHNILELLKNPDEQLQAEIAYHWDSANFTSSNLVEIWLEKVNAVLKSNEKYIGADIIELFGDVL